MSITDLQRLQLHQKIESCQSLRELKDLARTLLEREIARKRDEISMQLPVNMYWFGSYPSFQATLTISAKTASTRMTSASFPMPRWHYA